jgi:hypothetical protein
LDNEEPNTYTEVVMGLESERWLEGFFKKKTDAMKMFTSIKEDW